VDFSFSEEQELLRAQAQEFLGERFPAERIAELADSEEGWDPASWKELSGLGWTGVSVSEEEGGAGLGFLEEAVLFEELGRFLYPGPFFSTVALALPALTPELRKEVAAGDMTWTLALHGESGLVPDLGIVDRVAVADEDGIWALDGESREVLATMDPTRRLGRIRLEGATRTLLVEGDDAVELASAIRLRVLAALALEAVGIAQRVLELSVEHAKTREQFGRPIGVYQAVSHALADTYAETELARSLGYWAAWCVSENDGQAQLAAAAAKAYAADAAVAACERAIQVHGGIGFTWEHVLHRYYKRAQWIDAFEGFGHEHRADVARELLDVQAAAAVA
jgi:alkylation response protein AidB-like acyl-CoA dehydrogenase